MMMWTRLPWCFKPLVGLVGTGGLMGAVPVLLLLPMVVSGVVRVLDTRSEMSAAPLGEPSPEDVFAVAPLVVIPVVPRPRPDPNPPQNELENPL